MTQDIDQLRACNAALSIALKETREVLTDLRDATDCGGSPALELRTNQAIERAWHVLNFQGKPA